METPLSVPESEQKQEQQQPQQQEQQQEQQQPQQQEQQQEQQHQQGQEQNLNQVNPQVQQEQSQPLTQYPQQPPPQTQDYYYQTQGQSYDQSYYSYYQQYPYQNQWQYDQQSQNYAYYQPDYSAAYPQPVYQHHDPAIAVSAPHDWPPPVADSGGTAAPVVQQQPQPQPQPQFQQQSAFPQIQSSGNPLVPPGMNPAAAAAIAALQQLTQFAGTMGAAERAMAGFPVEIPGFGPVPARPLDGRHVHRGGGRRGGGPLQGGRGFVGHNHGSAPPFRGKGRGRGKGRPRHFQAQGTISTSSHPEPSTVTKHSADATENAGQSAPLPEKAASKHAQIAWCELCRVDCNSLEILEQHKNGKRHKKNLVRMEELKNTVKPGEEIPNNQESVIDTKPEDVENQKPAENLPSETTGDKPKMENNPENSTGKLPEVPAETPDQQEDKPKMNMFENRRLGKKRKMKSGRGGKRMRTSETYKRPIEPPRPKVVIPLMCDLCNVKCDTKEVLDRHLSGKKHIAKLKRFEGHQAMYGPRGLQVLYPPNPIAQNHFFNQGHQPFSGPLGSFPPHEGSVSFQAHQSAVGSDPQVSQNFIPQQAEATVSHEANPATTV